MIFLGGMQQTLENKVPRAENSVGELNIKVPKAEVVVSSLKNAIDSSIININKLIKFEPYSETIQPNQFMYNSSEGLFEKKVIHNLGTNNVNVSMYNSNGNALLEMTRANNPNDIIIQNDVAEVVKVVINNGYSKVV